VRFYQLYQRQINRFFWRIPFNGGELIKELSGVCVSTGFKPLRTLLFQR